MKAGCPCKYNIPVHNLPSREGSVEGCAPSGTWKISSKQGRGKKKKKTPQLTSNFRPQSRSEGIQKIAAISTLGYTQRGVSEVYVGI